MAKRTILLVDDDVTLRELLADALERSLKHAVLGKRRGETALLAMVRLPESQVVFKEGNYPNLPANVKLPWAEFMATLLAQGGMDARST